MSNLPIPADEYGDHPWLDTGSGPGYTRPLHAGWFVAKHAWTLTRDEPNKRFVWTCSCGYEAVQPFGAPVPDELISHPQEHGQMRGQDRD